MRQIIIKESRKSQYDVSGAMTIIAVKRRNCHIRCYYTTEMLAGDGLAPLLRRDCS